MGAYFQVVGIVLTAVFLGLALQKQNKESVLLLGICVCVMVLIAAMSYISPVLDFIESLRALSTVGTDVTQIILKAVGIGIVSEIAETICNDSGNSAMGKTIQYVSACAILWLSLPIMKNLLEMIQQILEGAA